LLITPAVIGGAEETGSDGSVIKIGGDNAYPPYEYLDEEGKPAGYNVDMMRAVADAMGMDIKIQLSPWAEVRRRLEEGELDAVTGMVYSEERDRRVDFCSPHITTSGAIFVRKGSAFHALDDLRNREIIVQEDDIMHDYILTGGPACRLITVENPEEALRLLSSGEHDGALLSKLIGSYLIRESQIDNIEPVGRPLPGRKYCFAVQEGDGELLAMLNEGLAIIKTSGKAGEIYEKWFGAYEKREFRKYAKYFWGALVVLAILLSLSFLWSRSLKRRVDKRTGELQEELVHRRVTEAEARKLSRIVENTPMAIVLTDLKGNIEYVNPGLLALSGYSSDKGIIGKSMFIFTDPDGVKRLREEVIPALLAGENWRGEIAMRNKDGSYYTSELSSSLITDQEGRPEYMLGGFMDITDRKQTETSLEESERRYRRLTESVDNYIFSSFFEDGQPVRTVYSPTCLAITGYTSGELEADINLWSEMVLEEDREIIREQFSSLLAGDALDEVEYRIKRKDGEVRWISTTIAPTYGASGDLISYDGICRDITDRKLVEEVLNEHHDHLQEMVEERTAELKVRVRQSDQLNRGMVNLMEDSREIQCRLTKTGRQLEAANAELETFAYSAAHDLKAPLRAIEGYIEAVLDDYGDRLEEEGREYAGRITGVCRRMAGLIDDLLSYSHLSQSEIRVKSIELAPLIDKALENLDNRIKESSGVVEVAAPLPMVLANRSILLQLVENLISNALTFVAPGVEPEVKIWTYLKDGMVRLCVDDNGIGISEEDRGRIFQVFERLHGIETYPGTGIGLAIVRRGVTKMGGRVGFDSEVGKGSTFWIELPEAEMTRDK
jgi:PAS domain S-box-containing protein